MRIVIGEDQALLREGIQEALQLPFIEAQQIEVAFLQLQLREERREVVFLPGAPRPVVSKCSLFRQGLGDIDEDGEDGLPAELLRRPVAHVPGPNRPVQRREDGAEPEEVGIGFK